MRQYLEFHAVGNAVVGTLDNGTVAQGYANEKQVVICTCASVPDWIAEDVAQEIARLLNNEAQSVLPYRDVTEQIKVTERERHG